MQLGALAANLWRHGFGDAPEISQKLNDVGFLIDRSNVARGHPSSKWWPVLHALIARRAPALSDLSIALADLEKESPADTVLSGVFLALSTLGYYPAEGIPVLTQAFIDSGKIFDYRPVFEQSRFKLVRRYPTGGVSEKCALILPAMVECFGAEFGIKSPFSVGRALGFTGGTWDKLSAIDGFTFPEPGDPAIEILRKGHCAITVTLGEAAPADRVMYLRRSQTNTIECDALIVSSIASKHAAVPVHHMILDSRVGSAAFIPDVAAAERIGTLIGDALRPRGIELLVSVLDNVQPDGAAIGDYLEILEATEIMCGTHSGRFDMRGKRAQLAICSDFFVKMVQMARPAIDSSAVIRAIDNAIASGSLWQAQRRFLRNHGVTEGTLDALEADPWHPMAQVSQVQVRSRRSGRLAAIDQRAAGMLVNGGFAKERQDRRSAGIVLSKRLYDPVREGDLLCTVYGAANLDTTELADSLFAVS